ncbi:PepSY domain-containing protein [Streptomyces fulvorobeus]|uniref:Lipoprotein n=1 Tax=Streptomyces fulvorobeus TaxID=284028 RepID=A0A7J0BYU6_9ACTN|nr:PepSY domain-containing protein [Streptomyces fulvorobeus]NYE39201.1 putative membrane protein YkoI [Streptomyces fulvorobeus]GFM95408.1 lipoprotein [Streptomyces fulvorobeus]
MSLEFRRTTTVSARSRRLRIAAGALCAVVASALVAGCGQDGGDQTGAATSEAAKVIPEQTTSPSGSPSPGTQLSEDQAERKKLLETTKITFDKAATAAVGAVPGSKLVELDLEGLDDDTDRRTDASASPTGSASPGGSASPSGSPAGTASPNGTASPSGSPSPSGSGTGPHWVAEVVETDGTAHTVRIDAVSGTVIEESADTGQDAEDKREMADWITKAKQTPEQAAKVATDKKKGKVTSMGLDTNDDNTLVWAVDLVSADWNKTEFEVDAASGTIVREETDRD